MSRKSRERWLEAEEKWPTLQQFIACLFHQDAHLISDSIDGLIKHGVGSWTLGQRQQVAREWWDWNQTAGAIDDIRQLLTDGLGVDWNLATPLDARKFMNAIYHAIIVSVRAEAGKDWKP